MFTNIFIDHMIRAIIFIFALLCSSRIQVLSLRDYGCSKSMIELPKPIYDGVMYDYIINGEISKYDVKGIEENEIWIQNIVDKEYILSIFYHSIPTYVYICSNINPNINLKRIYKYTLNNQSSIYKEKVEVYSEKSIIKEKGEIKLNNCRILSKYL